jgi:hypothetical protein
MDSTDGNQHVSIVHEKGQSVTLTKEGDIVLASADGQSVMGIIDGSPTIGGGKVAFTGGIVATAGATMQNKLEVTETNGFGVDALLGYIATTAPLELGAQAGGEFAMKSTQLLLWVAQVNACLTALAGATGGTVPAITAPTAVPATATKVKVT